MNQLYILSGSLRYEFKMQIRRRSLWITMSLFILLIILVGGRTNITSRILNHLQCVGLCWVCLGGVVILNFIFPVAIGVLLADRLPRDRRTKVDELFNAMPGALSSRLLGKYFGATLATLIPMFAFYCLGIAFIFYKTTNPLTFLYALETFPAIVLPGILFISSFSIACPAIMWVPLYQFLYVGYWFWGNALNSGAGIPTLNDTLLTPIGGYMSKGFFGVYTDRYLRASPLQGLESMLLLLAIAVLVLFVLWKFLQWQQTQ